MPSTPDHLPFAEALGLRPLGLALQQTRLALSGDPYAPPSRFGPSSLRILRPALSARTWLSRRQPRVTPIYNLFNHTQTPEADGWSVRKTQVRDYRGGALTYDMFHANYHPTRFTRRPPLYRGEHARGPRLALPLEPERFDGVEYLSD